MSDPQVIEIGPDGAVKQGSMSLDEVLTMILGVGGGAPKQVRHVTFADPPGDMTAKEYEDKLREVAAEAPAEHALRMVLLNTLGLDNVLSHGVPQELVFDAITKFAHELWAHAHPEGETEAEPKQDATKHSGPYL